MRDEEIALQALCEGRSTPPTCHCVKGGGCPGKCDRLYDIQRILTALSSAGRLVGDATFDPETRGTNVGSLPPLTAAQGGSISVTRVTSASAPHPAPDATAKREVERGRFVIDDPAPDATVKCNKCDGAGWLWSHELGLPRSDDTRYTCDVCEGKGKLPSAPDATDWKALCGAAVMERNAAQAENRQLRAELAQCRKSAEVTERLHDNLRDAIDDAFEVWPIGIANASHKILRNAAALSPPPLSPEKP